MKLSSFITKLAIRDIVRGAATTRTTSLTPWRPISGRVGHRPGQPSSGPWNSSESIVTREGLTRLASSDTQPVTLVVVRDEKPVEAQGLPGQGGVFFAEKVSTFCSCLCRPPVVSRTTRAPQTEFPENDTHGGAVALSGHPRPPSFPVHGGGHVNSWSGN